MGSLSTGGGTSAVAASAHAGCPRFVQTDPLVTSISRRDLAAKLGHPDTSAGIPQARWIRAMTFERLVRDERFVSQLLSTVVGGVGLPRPTAVRRSSGGVNIGRTATELTEAHGHTSDDVATMITDLGVPFVGMEAEQAATYVKPDFAVVAPRRAADRSGGQPDDGAPIIGSWLIMGDAKDYERVRSRIDDPRMLKGFLQVALGAESAEAWSALPETMKVHDWGTLAVPRNAFLQPQAIVERLDDHRIEVRAKAAERRALMDKHGRTIWDEAALLEYASDKEAAFEPATCVTCSLFNVCRTELRRSTDDGAVLVELGIRPEMRSALLPLVTADPVSAGSPSPSSPTTNGRMPAPESVMAGIRATISGHAQWTGLRRLDPAGTPGSINVVLAKSDSASLGVHGIGLRRGAGPAKEWSFSSFANPQAPQTRTAIMGILGREIAAALTGPDGGSEHPVTIVLPDAATGDLLVSIADSLAGIETSRLRWQRDIDAGREPLTFDGETATVPEPLTYDQRLAVSFLLEEDRARAMTLRWPLVDLRTILARHVVPGGPAIEAGRLDYLLRWAEASAEETIDHRAITDEIASRRHTPGARLSNDGSNAIHGCIDRQADGGPDPDRYLALVEDELRYKTDIIDRSIDVLDRLPDSALRDAHQALEHDAQQIWRARLELHASDLVRFGRTGWVWRNNQVTMLDDDGACASKLSAIGDPRAGLEMALDAGTRNVALATVVTVEPLRLDIGSRRIKEGSTIVVIQQNGVPSVESDEVTLKILKGSFKLGKLSLGPLIADDAPDTDPSGDEPLGVRWDPKILPEVSIGDQLIIADVTWFGDELKSGHEINVKRPGADKNSAPTKDCDADSYAADPESHQWCCRSHEVAEAEWSDELAERRANNELNPEVWPPIIDSDQFDTPAAGTPTNETVDIADLEPSPEGLTMDDLD